ncbi:MAG: uracil-DNA glycosylase [Chloroflexota bacterium]|nr:uracil-DNA glycosylase [Chloroflexota bacterium]GIK66049.1 MAG: uracil-DNA glycosylase [Chloroflexota bacterium]
MAEGLSLKERQTAMEKIASEVRVCPKCPLSKSRTKAVPGDGPVNAEIMFVGEAPGFHEDQQGLPFVGASGKYLEQLLELIGLTRKDVFITNIVRCRPPQNRDPERLEIETCEPYLDQQIALIQPRIIATLGRYSMAKFFPDGKISKIHGVPKKEDGRIYYPLFHPAAVLRNPALREPMEEDFKRMKKLLEELRAAEPAKDDDAPPPPPPPEKPQQLSLF